MIITGKDVDNSCTSFALNSENVTVSTSIYIYEVSLLDLI